MPTNDLGLMSGLNLAEDRSYLYHPKWAPELLLLSAALRAHAQDIVEQFYQEVCRLPKSAQLINALTEEELQHLKSQQIRNLYTLADPQLTEVEHHAMALNVGRIHAIIGLDKEDLVRSRGILSAALFKLLDDPQHAHALTLLALRLNRDLVYQIEAYQQLRDAHQEVLLHITNLAWSVESYTDMIDQIVGILGNHAEFAGCSIGRPDRQGIFRFESASTGAHMVQYQLDLESAAECVISDAENPLGQGPTARAWRSGEVECNVNFATDARMRPWMDSARREGFRSSVAIPLSQPGCAPMAVLTLYSAYPGGYSSANHMAFITLLKTLLGFAVTRIENQEGRTSTVPYALRQHWGALLRTPALEMHYQPLRDLNTGRINKVEALARLRDGARLLAPGEFFSALSSEDFLQLYVLGLKQALLQRSRWLQDGITLNVSLNLPPRALCDQRYLKATREALAEHGCAPDVLTLEVLESDALPYGVDAYEELGKYKALGIMLAEDDLGSGHSSLIRLRELPFDWIKIDRSIVSPVGQDPSNVLRFVYQLTRLGHSLGKSVVVEGIENQDMLEACLVLGVDVAQGYEIAKPMAPALLGDWLRQLPALPDCSTPKTQLGRLAKLLICEERLHLISEDEQAYAHLAEVISLNGQSSRHGHACSLTGMANSACSICPITSFLSDIEAILPNTRQTQEERYALIQAALVSGTRSAAYQSARERLVAQISAGATALRPASQGKVLPQT